MEKNAKISAILVVIVGAMLVAGISVASGQIAEVDQDGNTFVRVDGSSGAGINILPEQVEAINSEQTITENSTGNNNLLVENQQTASIGPTQVFNINILKPLGPTVYSTSLPFIVQTSRPTKCTYVVGFSSKPPEYLPGYPLNNTTASGGVGGGAGGSLPSMDTVDGLTHKAKIKGLSEQNNNTLTAVCTDAEGTEAKSSVSFVLDLDDKTLPVINSFTPTSGKYISSTDRTAFSLNYTEDWIGEVGVIISAGNKTIKATNPSCESGTEQVCEVTVRSSDFDYLNSTKLDYYFKITDGNYNTVYSGGLQYHLRIDYTGEYASEYNGVIQGTELFGPAGYASGKNIVDYLYSYKNKGPIYYQGNDHNWHEEIFINLSKVHAERDDKQSGYDNRYDEVFLNLEPEAIVYRLVFESSINENGLKGQKMWFLGKEWTAFNVDYAAGTIDLSATDGEVLLTTSQPNVSREGVALSLGGIFPTGEGGLYRAKLTVTNGGLTETKYVTSGSNETIAGIDVYVKNALITTSGTNEGEAQINFGSGILKVREGKFLKLKDGTDAPWKFMFDYGDIQGAPFQNIALVYGIPDITPLSVNEDAGGGSGGGGGGIASPATKTLKEYEAVSLPYTTFKLQYTGLTNRYGATVSNTELRIQTKTISSESGDRQAIVISTPKTNAVQYYDDTGMKQLRNQVVIFPDNLTDPYYYDTGDKFLNTLGGEPRVKVWRNAYANITYTAVENSTTKGYITIKEPFIYNESQAYRDITIEYNNGLLLDINNDTLQAYVYAAGYGQEGAPNYIASTLGVRDLYTRYGTFISSASNGEVIVHLPANQLHAEYVVPQYYGVKLMKARADKPPLKLIEKDGKINFLDSENKTRIILPEGFDATKLAEQNIIHDFDTAGSSRGFVILDGVELPAGYTKTLVLNKRNTDSNGVCVRDSKVLDVSEFSSACPDDLTVNQTLVSCDGSLVTKSFGNYTCTLSDSQYTVTGLRHSGAAEYTPQTVQPGGNPGGTPSSGGGGGGGGGSVSNPKPKEEKKEAPKIKEEPQVVIRPVPQASANNPEQLQKELDTAAAPTGFLSLSPARMRYTTVILAGAALFAIALYTQRHKISLLVPQLGLLTKEIKVEQPQLPQAIKITPLMEKRIKSLHERESEIVRYLIENGGESTQAQIRHASHIPNTSLGRWVFTLQQKGLIETERDRKVKDIKLTKEFLEDVELKPNIQLVDDGNTGEIDKNY